MSDQPIQPQSENAQTPLNEAKFAAALDRRLQEMLSEQSIGKAIIFGILAAVAGALIWAAITVITGSQIGYVAIGLGILVGFAVKFGGKGLTPVYGVIGALLAVVSCILGNYFSGVGFVASEGDLSYTETMKLLPIFSTIPLMLQELDPMDFLFFGLAGYFGYKFSIRSLDEDDLAAIQHESQL